MHVIRSATLRPGATINAVFDGHPAETVGEQKRLILGKALIFWDPTLAGTKYGKKRDAIDTDQITPAADCVSETLETLDERWKVGAFRYLMPDFRARVHRGETFIVAGDDERLAAMNAGTEIGHQIAEGANLPSFIEGFKRLGHAVGGRRDLVGVDGVPLLAVLSTGKGRIPEDQRLAKDQPFLFSNGFCRMPVEDSVYSRAWPERCTTNYVHLGRS